MESELVARYGGEQRARLRRGMGQVADFWRAEDGDRGEFESFVRTHFAGDTVTLANMFARLEYLSEQLSGHMGEIILEFRRQSDLDLGPILPFDRIFAGYNPAAHINDDFFANKLAFVVLLNFPLTTLEQRVTEGDSWTRREWAEVRLAQAFDTRIPADVLLAASRAGARADQYVAEYNIWMHHLLDDRGRRLFPAGLRLLSHWNLRDEIKANYGAGEDGLAKQRMIQQVMERIVTQTIPEVVVDNPHVDWNPHSNQVGRATVQDGEAPPPTDLEVADAREPDTRYDVLLGQFQAARLIDAYSPTAPTAIARSFDQGREIPEQRVEAMFEAVLSSPLLARVGRLIEARLGRPLQPFDIWYSGFRPSATYDEAELDRIVAERYPTAEAYQRDILRMLRHFGFNDELAQTIADNIVVDPARGSGHAWGASMRSAKAHLRTRVGAQGMDYKGYNIAVHEMGHNVEQILSLNFIDHYMLSGVPNAAFTEALAMVFQARDLELLGLASVDARDRALQTLDEFWGTAEIAAVSLVDMRVWHWLYEHPTATAAELREAAIGIAQDVWNTYFAPIFGMNDVVLLAIYSHQLNYPLYLPNYTIGHMIAFQIEEQMQKAGSIGAEFERMCAMGNVTPDLWMKKATGSPVGPEALLAATERALRELGAVGSE
ncbi:MAG: hypothetical protein JSV86_11735 [Gemmatimonadota bacterium]|nr:MAG: hypothetical protein JSV86_11735 [Gemmatimonadota bacterium]